jgi:predicted dehydrogenase
MNRRDFLSAGAAGLALCATGVHIAAQEKKPRVGLIGCGWYGKCDITQLLKIHPVEIVSLCDVDKKMLADAADIFAQRQESKKKPKTFTDYREMLKEKDCDIIEIATPDHWHALPMIAACEAGADLYVQKPISVDVVEGRAMVAAARKHNRVVQVGTQRRSTPHLVEARDRVIKEGKLGRVGHVEICCYYHMRARENPPDTAPPANLDYEMWTGPAPMRAYNSLVHPRRWRAFMEYGNGIMGDMCIHMLDMVRWMLDLGWPKRVSSAGGILVEKNSKANIPDTQSATFDFGDLQVVWQHRTYGDAPDKKYPWAAFIYGDKGTLKASVNDYEFFPLNRNAPTLSGKAVIETDKYKDDESDVKALALELHVASAIRGHMQDLLKATGSRSKPIADIEQGHISTASCILANLSLKLGRSLTWDATKQEVVGDAEANKLLRRPYRSPWMHPEAPAI